MNATTFPHHLQSHAWAPLSTLVLLGFLLCMVVKVIYSQPSSNFPLRTWSEIQMFSCGLSGPGYLSSLYPAILYSLSASYHAFFLAALHGLWDSSPNRDQIWAPAVKVPCPKRWTTKEFPIMLFFLCHRAVVRIK